MNICSVCGKSVGANKNLFVEHKNKRGEICYGSFTPIKNINPFQFKRPPGIGMILESPWGNPPAEHPVWSAEHPDPVWSADGP